MPDPITEMLASLNEIISQYITSLRSEAPLHRNDPRGPREDDAERREECAQILERLMPVTSPEQVLVVRDALDYIGEELEFYAPGYGESS